MKLGNFDISLLSDGTFWLDGGGMFGVVPKAVWNKFNPADEWNRIELGLNCLLIQTYDKNILVDTGIGDKFDEKFQERFKVNKTKDLIGSLKGMGLTPEDIDMVISTHLHFDHAGGNTHFDLGNPVPSFPQAKYVIQRGEWADAINPNERTRASYLKENLIPIQEAGLLELIEGDKELLPGVRTIVTGGHTPNHQIVLLESEGRKALYLGDLVPTTSHIKTPYVMGYDLYPLDTMREKKEVLSRALDEHWLLIFEHDPKIGMGYLSQEGDKLKLDPIQGEEDYGR